ncbi:uncharacterized protein LOC120280022 [Dioscorea cayenensis subsp. rotundata]|uniref:Uncharacterized protein LOC120280022 n=1 Tax=Dioscorea cayennensis subsp. rotundata TaxID=55577 RepID=A0AB40CVN2_DIOCR|nr:uncharacterized protein LOC120280022 [Dioscorea cayenensis subsp. rotundata]
MSSLVGAHGMAFATAMAVSGTVILLALCRPRSLTDASTQNPQSKKLGLRPCINSSSSGESSQMMKNKQKNKKKKRVRFAEDVVVEFEAEGSSEDEFGFDCNYNHNYNYGEEEYGVAQEQEEKEEGIVEKMPANRVALYNGILQARMHRIACSY